MDKAKGEGEGQEPGNGPGGGAGTEEGKGKPKGGESADKGKGAEAVQTTAVFESRDGDKWKPTAERGNPSRECIKRVRHDVRSLARDPIPGIFACPDEDVVTLVHGLVVGPTDTPYEGGFFYFVMRCPDDYPHSPPKVRLMTTGGGTVRFNPNLYKNGKVCLSILDTWTGPRWTPVNSIGSVLLCIQSLLNDKPYLNEPGFEDRADPQDVRDHSDCIQHETIRVAVYQMVGTTSLARSLPGDIRTLTRSLFDCFLYHYRDVCEQNMHRDGQPMRDPFKSNKGLFQYGALLRKINQIAKENQAGANDQGGATGEGSEVQQQGSDLQHMKV
ncbi:unnamed protein product [Discosporangium mesarthrocarpum]